MANPKKWESQLADASGNPLVGAQQANLADITFTYTTDDPNPTINSVITIADGDGTLVTAEVIAALEKLAAKINAILDVLEAHGLMAD